MTMNRRHIIGLLFVAVAALPYVLMVTANEKTSPSAGKTEKLSITSPHRREVRLEYSRAFREWMQARHNRDVEIVWVDVGGGTSKIIKDLESRYAASPGAPGVDLLFGGGMSPYLTAKERGWLQRVELPGGIMEDIPPLCAGQQVYDPEHYWYGVALSGFGIIYNRVLIERMGMSAPRTWSDLGRPDFFTWLASGDPRSSGSVHKCYEIILQSYGFERGWGLITRICANVHRFGEGGSAAPMETATRDAIAGMVIDQYAQTVINLVGGNSLGFVLPGDATVIDADSIGLLRGAPQPELGRLFMEFVLSGDGQRVLFQPAGTNGQVFALNRLPVRKSCYDLSGAPAGRPYDFESDFKLDSAKEGARREVVDAMIGVCLIDGHAELAGAWKRVIEGGMEAGAVSRLCQPPVTEDQIPLICGQWKNPRMKLEITRRWAEESRARYRGIERRPGG